MSFLSALAFCLLGSLSPQEAQSLFEKANQEFAAKNHVQAKQAYQQLLEANFVGAELHHNLGTTCLELQELGCAIWNLEKASQFSPNAKDILFNLAWARSLQADSVPSVETPFLYRVLRNISDTLLAWALLACAWAVFLSFVCMRIFPKQARLFKTMDFMWWALLGLCTFTLAAKWYAPSQWEESIVLPETAVARQLPSEQATEVFKLHGGLKVRIVERAGLFAKIRTANGQEAWMRLEFLGLL